MFFPGTMKNPRLILVIASYMISSIMSLDVDERCINAIKPKDKCRADILRFYYDSATNACLPLSYGGCSNDQNIFETLEQCLDRCGNLDTTTNLNVIGQKLGGTHWKENDEIATTIDGLYQKFDQYRDNLEVSLSQRNSRTYEIVDGDDFNQMDTGSNRVGEALIVLLVVLIIAGIVFLVLKRKKNSDADHVVGENVAQ